MAATRRIGPLHIFAIQRRPHSVNGNPRFLLTTSGGTFNTKPDAALSYAIENYTNSHYPDTYAIGDDAPAVTLLATPRGLVWGIEKDGEVLR